ncbi:MAG: FAD-dependent oxidoreductase [bacterium]|nr:FAD-dependent oxidoreductase [bacterium]
MAHDTIYDFAIMGGGVVGCAVAFEASRSPEIQSFVLLEKYAAVAQVSSNVLANAETLHQGAKETNFPFVKALEMKRRSDQLIEYLVTRGKGVYRKMPSMVIGVTPEEVQKLEARYEMLKPYFPDLEFIRGERIGAIEPKVMEGRNEEEKKRIVALYSMGYAVDYEQLAQSFMREAAEEAEVLGKTFDVFFRTKARTITRGDDGLYVITTNRGTFRAKVIVVCAGPYSLGFAQKLGHPKALEYAILPAAGSFYYIPRKVLNGKVYTVQDDHIPFAAPHADRAVYNEHETRLGPTTIILPFFERYHFSTLLDFIRMGLVSPGAYMRTVCRILLDARFRLFELKNILYNIPWLGKYLFMRWAAKKIIPTIRMRDLHFGRGMGGIRPQLLNLVTRELEMGIGKFVGEFGIFNVTPSPGASSCMGNAIEDIALVESLLDEWERRYGRR